MKWNDPVTVSLNLEKETRDFFKEIAETKRESLNSIVQKALELAQSVIIERPDQFKLDDFIEKE